MARTAYGRLFKAIDQPKTDEGGPAAIPESTDETDKSQASGEKENGPAQLEAAHQSTPLRFAFAPDIRALVDPSPASLVSSGALERAQQKLLGTVGSALTQHFSLVPQLPGTDTHALHEGAISVACVANTADSLRHPRAPS